MMLGQGNDNKDGKLPATDRLAKADKDRQPAKDNKDRQPPRDTKDRVMPPPPRHNKTDGDKDKIVVRPPDPPTDDAECQHARAAAEWFLDQGGKVTLVVVGTETPVEIDARAKLPGEKFYLTRVESHPPRGSQKNTIVDADLDRIKDLKRLQSLAISWSTALTDVGLERIENLSGLTQLDLYAAKGVSNRGLNSIGKLKSLQTLLLEETNIDDTGIDSLGCLTQLETLAVTGTNVSGNGLAKLKHLPKLHRLLISAKAIMLGCERLNDMPNLTDITINGDGGGVGNDEIKRLPILGQVENVTLLSTQVKSDGLSRVAQFPKLANLNLYFSNIKDDDLAGLGRASNLKTLNLQDTGVTDAGIDQLKNHKGLTWINLANTAVTPQGARRLQDALPNCKIEGVQVAAKPERLPIELNAKMFQERFRGKVSYSEGRLTIEYDFTSKEQLKDFDSREAAASFTPKGMMLRPGDLLQHLVEFESMSVDGIVGFGNRAGVHLSTSRGLSVSGRSYNAWFADLVAGGKKSSTEPFSKDYNKKSSIEATMPFRLVIDKDIAEFKLANVATSLKTRRSFAGMLQLNGGDGGNLFRRITITGIVNKKWAIDFFNTDRVEPLEMEEKKPPFKLDVTPSQLRAKFHGIASIKDDILTIVHDFKSIAQLKDFDKQATMLPAGISIKSEETLRHVVKFQTLTVSGTAVLGDPTGPNLGTTEQIKISSRSYNAWFLSLGLGDRNIEDVFAPLDRRPTPSTFELRILDDRVFLKFGDTNLGGRRKIGPAGFLELHGGTKGNLFTNLRLSGTVDPDWAKAFFKRMDP